VGFFSYYRMFIGHLAKELLSFGVEQLVGVILAVLILVFQIHFGQIQTKDVRTSALATILWPYLVLAGFYVVVHCVRTPWKLHQDVAKQLEHQATQREITDQIASLTGFIQQAQVFTRLCRNSQDAVAPAEVQRWAEEAERSIESMVDGTYITRFRSGVGVPMGMAYIPNQENRNIDGAIWVRTYRLQEFIDELKQKLARLAQPLAGS
jgi:hypothetical protein